MSPTQREKAFDLICKSPIVGFNAKALSPSFISHSFFKPVKYDLNTMSIDTAVELTTKISEGSIDKPLEIL
ncbi:hypothetical protein HZS_8119 [Henneguya salminicola]|nr:hypothetical protein HZS_8119 [Henneguya salminicola]